jgi:DNA-binding response OmpR family regulator
MTRKILVADGDRRLPEILAGYELVAVHALEEAQRAIERTQFDMIVVGVHFDDSRMFDLLRYLQSSGRHAGRPLVCVRSRHFVSPAISIEGLEIAAKALGCTLFLDLTWYADDANGKSAVRKLLDQLLSP